MKKIDIVGDGGLRDRIVKYRPHKYFEYQMYWKKDVRIEGWDPGSLPF